MAQVGGAGAGLDLQRAHLCTQPHRALREPHVHACPADGADGEMEQEQPGPPEAAQDATLMPCTRPPVAAPSDDNTDTDTDTESGSEEEQPKRGVLMPLLQLFRALLLLLHLPHLLLVLRACLLLRVRLAPTRATAAHAPARAPGPVPARVAQWAATPGSGGHQHF